MVPSLSSGSSGPRPVISSRISETKSSSSCWLSASRSTRMYCVTSCLMCARISSSGSFSSAERLISSISRRCRRTLASSSLSVSSGLDACAAGSRFAGSGKTVQDTPSMRGRRLLGRRSRLRRGRAACGETTDHPRSSFRDSRSAPASRRVSAPASGPAQLEFLQPALAGGLRRRLRQHQLLELARDLVAGLDLVERNAAVDRLAHQAVVVRDAGGEGVAEHLLDVGLAQPGREQLLLEPVDDDLRLRPVAEPLVDRLDQLLGVAQARHRHLADDEQLVRAEQHAVGPGEPGARHVEHDVVEIGGDQVEQPRHHVRIERAHLGRPVGRGDHREAGRMMRQHHLEQLPVEALRPRLDLAEIEARLEVEIVGAGAVLEIEVDQAGRRLAALRRC